MAYNSNNQDSGWGLWLAAGLIVAALTLGVLIYIGWINSRTHVDSMNGDNVEQDYPITAAQAESFGVQDWQNPEHDSFEEVIVDHASTPEQTAESEMSD